MLPALILTLSLRTEHYCLFPDTAVSLLQTILCLLGGKNAPTPLDIEAGQKDRVWDEKQGGDGSPHSTG